MTQYRKNYFRIVFGKTKMGFVFLGIFGFSNKRNKLTIKAQGPLVHGWGMFIHIIK